MTTAKGSQVVAVTGASGGIGRASAIEFGRIGAKVALIARGTAGLAGAAREVEQAGGKAAHRKNACSWCLNPPVSSSALAM